MLPIKALFAKILTALKTQPVEFTPTFNSAIGGTGSAYGLYDPIKKTVTITGWYRDLTTAAGTTTNLFVVPSDYRPSSTKTGTGMTMNASYSPRVYSYTVNSAGNIREGAGSNVVHGFFSIAYNI